MEELIFLMDKNGLITIKINSTISSNHVTSLLQSTNGDIWVGTGYFLHKYDGQGFTVVDSTFGQIRCLLEAKKDGSIWAGTVNGLNKYDGQNWTLYGDYTLSDTYITSLQETPDGNIWVGTEDGLNKYDGKKWYTYYIEDANEIFEGIQYQNSITTLSLGKDSTFYVGTETGFHNFNDIDWTISHEIAYSDIARNFYCTLETKSGETWISTAGTVFKYTGQDWNWANTQTSDWNITPSGGIKNLLEDQNGNILGW